MASKGNIRSIRFSDAMIEIIEQQAGETFTAKFEALVTKCAWELPQKKQELERIQDQIKREREKLHRIQRKINDMDNLLFRMSSTVQTFNRTATEAMKALDKIIEET